MQGFIIRLYPSRDEDLIITLLTQNSIETAYRFYGARHSTINLGYKIDGELIYSAKSTMPQLRNVLHLAHSWQNEQHRMFIWQNFITLFYNHLKGIEQIDEFYFDLLEQMTTPMRKQNPKRLCIEAYLKLLEYEGRLHTQNQCFLCENEIQSDIALARGFLPAHANCLHVKPMKSLHVERLLNDKSTILLDDEMVERLWRVLLEGF